MVTRAARSGRHLRACAGLLVSGLLFAGLVSGAAGAPGGAANLQASKGGSTKPSSPGTSRPGDRGVGPATGEANLSQRRAVRGIPVDEGGESPELNEMRRFEEQAFPRGGANAASTADSDAVLDAPPSLPGRWEGTGDVPEVLRGPEATATPARVLPGPDSEWLRSLKLPELPVRWDPQVLRYLDYFKNDPRGRAVMASWIRRAGRFRSMFEAVLVREGLPKDLIYVAMVESGFETGARSPVGAGGVWQFMPGAARAYGLEVGYWVDARRDPEKSAEAAARYLKDLYVRFGSWHLVFAAYNAGYGAVLKSIARYNTNDYWELCHHEAGLPWESSLYVPKILAAAIVGHNLQAFGFGDIVPDPPFAYERVEVPAGTSMTTVSRAASTRPEVISALNPQIIRDRAPPDRGKYEVRVPPGTAALFAEAFERSRGAGDRLETVTLRFGETLDDVARSRRITVRELRRLNGVKDSAELRAGITIVVPQKPSKGVAMATTPAKVGADSDGSGTVAGASSGGSDESAGSRRGASDGAGAKGTAAEEEEILVAVPDRVFNYEGRERVFYRTRDGDTLDDIAAAVGVRSDDLVDWNNLDITAKLHPRMVLQIFVRKDFDPTQIVLLDSAKVRVVTLGSQEFLDLEAARRGKRRLVVEAKTGETLARIGRRYGLTVGDLARINRFSYNTELQPGQKVVVYSPVGATPRETAQGLTPEPRRDRGGGGAAPSKSAAQQNRGDDRTDGKPSSPKVAERGEAEDSAVATTERRRERERPKATEAAEESADAPARAKAAPARSVAANVGGSPENRARNRDRAQTQAGEKPVVGAKGSGKAPGARVSPKKK